MPKGFAPTRTQALAAAALLLAILVIVVAAASGGGDSTAPTTTKATRIAPASAPADQQIESLERYVRALPRRD
jgi:hypothetical protein